MKAFFNQIHKELVEFRKTLKNLNSELKDLPNLGWETKDEKSSAHMWIPILSHIRPLSHSAFLFPRISEQPLSSPACDGVLLVINTGPEVAVVPTDVNPPPPCLRLFVASAGGSPVIKTSLIIDARRWSRARLNIPG